MDMFVNTVYWGVLLSIGSYMICNFIQKKTKIIILNPLLISTTVTILFLSVFNIDYPSYYDTVDFLYYLLSPATVCLAVPLYKQFNILKKNIKAILGGIISGVLSSMISILFFSIIFQFSHVMYITLLPKSITAAIASSISQEMGGISSLTVPIVILTGITGHIISEKIFKLFKITEPIAKGIALGSASHVMGTSKAIEMGEIEGAMSSLSITVTGVITVIFMFAFVHLY
jgi:putative effector of murein hydrolase